MVVIIGADDWNGPPIIVADDARNTSREYRGTVNRARELVAAWVGSRAADAALALALAA
jgi:hypothetical protein